jgi:hypothetical protein
VFWAHPVQRQRIADDPVGVASRRAGDVLRLVRPFLDKHRA